MFTTELVELLLKQQSELEILIAWQSDIISKQDACLLLNITSEQLVRMKQVACGHVLNLRDKKFLNSTFIIQFNNEL